MKYATSACLLLCMTILLGSDCQGTLPAGLPIASPLEAGVYSGQSSCTTTVVDDFGTTQEQPPEIAFTFEFSANGIPIIRGEEIAVGRRERLLEGFDIVYTRLAALPDGIVIHANVVNTQGAVVGSTIATLQQEGSNTIRYQYTGLITEGTTFTTTDCDTPLTRL